MRRRKKPKVFCSLLLLHRFDFDPRLVLMCQSICDVHQTRVEGMLDLLAASHRRTPPVSHLRSASVCSIHHHHVRNTIERNLERRDRHRAA